MALSYCLVQLALWWLFHTTAFFWKAKFPFQARSFEMLGRIKYLHISCVALGIVVPLTPVIALMADFALEVQSNEVLQAENVTFISGGLGFTMGRFPPTLCYGYSSSVIFYTNVVPIILILSVGLTELILVFALIQKVKLYHI